MNISNGNSKGLSNGSGHLDSVSGGAPAMGSHYGGAQPISMDGSNRKNARRESIASSLVGGMSWGGVSVGSWIRDEYGLVGYGTGVAH
jgi:transcription factor SFP1